MQLSSMTKVIAFIVAFTFLHQSPIISKHTIGTLL